MLGKQRFGNTEDPGWSRTGGYTSIEITVSENLSRRQRAHVPLLCETKLRAERDSVSRPTLDKSRMQWDPHPCYPVLFAPRRVGDRISI